MEYSSNQRSSLVLRRHHDGYPPHAGNVGGGDGGGGEWRGHRCVLDLYLRLAVAHGRSLGLRQLGVALRSRQRAPVGAGLRGDGLVTGQGAVVVVAVVGGGGCSMVAGWSVTRRAACGGDDGGGVRGGTLGVLLQVVVGWLFVVGAGGDGGQGAILGDDV